MAQASVPTGFTPPQTWSGSASLAGRPPAWSAQAVERQAALQLPLSPTESAPSMPPLRVVGQVSATYIIAEGPDGLYLIDQHAAHERVLYERLMAQREETIPSQGLLEPVGVELSAEATTVVAGHVETLRRLGFDLEPFGPATWLVRALPAVLSQAQPAQVLLDVAMALEEDRSAVDEEVEQAVMRRVCKQAAVKAGQVLTQQEMEELIRALERCVSPRTCPHGRPTMIHISTAQLASEFGRE